uniref:Uncharacterized protein n=1 Tax=Arundo donax TaxID=35708 RepID=A0A0A8Z186_ARUDO
MEGEPANKAKQLLPPPSMPASTPVDDAALPFVSCSGCRSGRGWRQ